MSNNIKLKDFVKIYLFSKLTYFNRIESIQLDSEPISMILVDVIAEELKIAKELKIPKSFIKKQLKKLQPRIIKFDCEYFKIMFHPWAKTKFDGRCLYAQAAYEPSINTIFLSTKSTWHDYPPMLTTFIFNKLFPREFEQIEEFIINCKNNEDLFYKYYYYRFQQAQVRKKNE